MAEDGAPPVSKEEPSLLCTEQDCDEESSEYNTVIVSGPSEEHEASDSAEYSIIPPDNPHPSDGHDNVNLMTVCGTMPDPSQECYSSYSREVAQGPGFFNAAGQFQPVNLKMALPPTLPLPRRSARCPTSYRLPSLMYNPGPAAEYQRGKTQAESLEETIPPTRKKSRTLYNIDQLQELERMFVEDHYPDSEKRREIAEIIGVTPQRIMVWFQNRRAKWRKVEKTAAKGVKRPTSSMAAAPCTRSQGASLNTASSLPAQPEPVSYTVSTVHHPYGSLLGVRNGVSMVPGNHHLRSQSLDMSQHSSSCSSNSSGSVSSLESPGAVCLPPSQQYPPTFSSPPPLRRVNLPMSSMTFNASNHMVPLMLDTPESTPTPPATEGNIFTYRIQESPAPDTMAAPRHFGTQYYHQTNQMGHYQMPQYMQYPRLPLHNLTPTSPEETSFMAVPANNPGMLTYGNTGAFLQQGRPAGHILLQPGTGGLAFHSSTWNNMYLQGAPFPCSHPQLDAPRNIPEQPLYSQPAPQVLQNPQNPTTLAQSTTEMAKGSEPFTKEDTDA